MRRKSNVLLLTCILLLAPPLGAGMYKWVDENGVTHYSERPPAGRQAQEIAPPPPPAVSPDEGREALRQRLEDFDSRRTEEQEATEQADADATEQARRAENCRRARANLEKLQNPRRRVVNAAGEAVYLTDDERQARVDEANQAIAENCD